MLFPFNNRMLSIPDFGTEYLGTIIGDLKRLAVTGHVAVLMEERADVLSLMNGEPVSGCRWFWPEGIQRLPAGAGPFLSDLPERVTVEVLQADEGAVAMARLFCRIEPAWRGDGERDAVFRRWASSGTVVLARHHGPVCELALVDDGRMSVAYRFDEFEGIFRRVGPSFWDVDVKPKAVLEAVVAGSLLYPYPELAFPPDPLEILTERYVLVLDLIRRIVSERHGDETREIFSRILETYKKKYSPLYRGVYMNPETGEINWKQLLVNRDRVNIKYRYEKFLLYLDEVLVHAIRMLSNRTGADGMRELTSGAARLKKASPDLDSRAVRTFFRKLYHMIKNR